MEEGNFGYVTMTTSFNEGQHIYLQNGNNYVSVSRVLEVNELILGKFVEQSLAHSKHSVSVSYPHI